MKINNNQKGASSRFHYMTSRGAYEIVKSDKRSLFPLGGKKKEPVMQTGESEEGKEVLHSDVSSSSCAYHKHNPIISSPETGHNSLQIITPCHHSHHNLVTGPNHSHLTALKYSERRI